MEDEIDTVFVEHTGCILTDERPVPTINTRRKSPMFKVPTLPTSAFKDYVESMTFERLLALAEKYGYDLTV